MKLDKKATAQLLGATLRQRRKALNLTQETLGQLAGCGLAFIYEVEKGKATVRLDKLLDVLAVLGLQLSVVPGKLGMVVDERVK